MTQQRLNELGQMMFVATGGKNVRHLAPNTIETLTGLDEHEASRLVAAMIRNAVNDAAVAFPAAVERDGFSDEWLELIGHTGITLIATSLQLGHRIGMEALAQMPSLDLVVGEDDPPPT